MARIEQGDVECLVRRTHCLIFLHSLVVSSSKLGPLCKLILGAGVVHFSLQLESLALQSVLFARITRRRGWEFHVENP